MSDKPKIYHLNGVKRLAQRLRSDFNDSDFILLFAYNGTGKTRLSMEFKDAGKRKNKIERDTLYFNAYTEDLFHWDNDLEGNAARVLKINSGSRFFAGFKQLALEDKIFSHLERYGDFNFKIDYENWTVSFSRKVITKHKEIITRKKTVTIDGKQEVIDQKEAIFSDREEIVNDIKISRGEENIFIWCVFLSLCDLTIDGAEAYSWVDYLYIDDPISSLDDNNAIAVASDLAKVLRRQYQNDDGQPTDATRKQVKVVISSHHSLFFNVMCNELGKMSHKKYFLHRGKTPDSYSLRATDDTPFFHHVAMLSELRTAIDSDQLYTYHFNMLRSIMEKTATFFGFDDFSDCIPKDRDQDLHARVLNLLSHGRYSIFEPKEMVRDNKMIFKNVFSAFMGKYQFNLPEIFGEDTKKANTK